MTGVFGKSPAQRVRIRCYSGRTSYVLKLSGEIAAQNYPLSGTELGQIPHLGSVPLLRAGQASFRAQSRALSTRFSDGSTKQAVLSPYARSAAPATPREVLSRRDDSHGRPSNPQGHALALTAGTSRASFPLLLASVGALQTSAVGRGQCNVYTITEAQLRRCIPFDTMQNA